MAAVLKPFIYVYLKIKYNFKTDKLADKRPYLVIFNHQTAHDQFFLPFALRNSKLYFVMSDDLDSIPFVSKILRFLFGTIPYKKASMDAVAIKKMYKTVSEGSSIFISPEGNRTYTGETAYINPTIAKLVKFLKVPVAIFNIHGFYAYPRFADKPRHVPIKVDIKKIIEPEEYQNMDNDALYQMIKENLYVNDYDHPLTVKNKHRAERLERVIYYCDNCKVSHFISKNDTITCQKCNTTYHLDEHYMLDHPKHKTIIDWYNYQRKVLLEEAVQSLPDDEIITDDIISLYKVIPNKKKELLKKNVKILMYKNRIEIEGQETIAYFKDIASTGCFGRNKINLIFKDNTLQIKGNKQFNALKYVQYIYKYKIEEELQDNEFLGI